MTTPGTNSRLLLSVLAAVAASSAVASASPLVNLQILGSTDGVHYSSSLTGIFQGQTYDFEVVGQLAPVGTVNARQTITGEVEGVDGIGSLSFNLLDAGSNAVQISFTSAQLQGTFANGTGPSAGTPASSSGGTDNELVGVRPINPNGTFNALGGSPLVIESGTFSVLNAIPNSTSQITGTFGGTFSSIKINDGTGVTMTSPSESGSDPIQSIAPLNLTGPLLVPEPASLSMFVFGALSLLARRRRASV